MVKSQGFRLLPPLAAFLVLAATFCLPAVSQGSVVDQYTEERPTPGGNVPTEKPKAENQFGDNLESAAYDAGDTGTVNTSASAATRNPKRGFPAAAGDSTAAVSWSKDAPVGEVELSGAPDGMGWLFPASLFLSLALSVGFAVRRGLGMADLGSTR